METHGHLPLGGAEGSPEKTRKHCHFSLSVDTMNAVGKLAIMSRGAVAQATTREAGRATGLSSCPEEEV